MSLPSTPKCSPWTPIDVFLKHQKIHSKHNSKLSKNSINKRGYSDAKLFSSCRANLSVCSLQMAKLSRFFRAILRRGSAMD